MPTEEPKAKTEADTSDTIGEGNVHAPTEPGGTGESPSRRFPIVGIGASAGGLDAIETLLRRLSKDGMAFIVLQHLAPNHESLLPEILARSTSLTVVSIRENQRVETNTIYVAPPNADITVVDGTLHVALPADHGPRRSIDTFFQSLAADQGSMSIGVILSGAGTDGTIGLRAIKEDGGITFVQEPSTAAHSSMPESALDAGCADFCLSPIEIGDELMRLSAHPYVARKRPARLFSQDALSKLFGRLRRAFGVDFSAYKLTTVERRIERRMALQKIEKADDYLKLVEASATELNTLYSDLLIGVTGFFRDRDVFEALKSTIFPRLLEKRSTDLPIRIWVAGCSTGEEAYSIAICLLEALDGRPSGYKTQIFATDIDDRSLTHARAAVYAKEIEADVSPERLQRFFSRQDNGYHVARPVRDMVVFARHNLGKDAPFSRLDLVSCRNVLIYMQQPLQKKILRLFHYALNPDAFLLLGTSESVGDASDAYSLLDRKLKIYIKKNVPSAAVLDLSFGLRASENMGPPIPAREAPERRPAVSIQQIADRKVLDKYGPPGVMIDDGLNVIQFRGQTGPFLAPSPGTATLNILKLIRPELLLALRSAIQKAQAENLPVSSDPIPLPLPDGSAVVLDVLPLHDGEAKSRALLVLFHNVSILDSYAANDHAPPRSKEITSEKHIDDLQRELLATKEYLQTSIQELEAANEEMQSANEELQSSNEELQSTNEELMTSKEELQSTNEELSTVNEELQNRITQQSVANDDLQNILDTIDVPVVLVGMDLRIRRFSAAAGALLNLIPSDLGRPVSYLGTTLSYAQIEAAVSETINTVRTREQRTRGSDGRWYTMRITPYRTTDHAIRGVVIELMRTPAMRRIGAPFEIHELVGKVLSTLPDALLLLDDQLRIVWVNKSFFETFRVGAEVLGRSLDELWDGRRTHPALWEMLEGTVSGGQPFEGIRVEKPLGRENLTVKVSAHCMPAEDDRPALTLVVMEANATEGQG